MEDFLLNFLQQFPVAAPIIFILVRALALIIPPIPGIIIDSVGIALFKWQFGFVYSWLGLVLGAMGSFWIARYFKNPLVRRFPSLQKFSAIEHSLNSREEMVTLIAMRVFSNPLIDYLNFALGFTQVNAMRFFITAVIGYFPYALVIYLFGDQIIKRASVQVIGVVASLIIFAIVYRQYRIKNSRRR